MATIGQIIYNVQDYHSSGGYISTSNSDLNTTVSSNQANYLYNRINIFSGNLVDRYRSKEFSKLGIQAPPGTKVVLNETKNITIGRTGIYELDENIIITSLVFLRPKKYILDEARTLTALNLGISGMNKAEEDRQNALDALNKKYPGISAGIGSISVATESDIDKLFANRTKLFDEDSKALRSSSMEDERQYWIEYVAIQEAYQEAYQAALVQFNMGINGIYQLPNPNNIDAEENYQELYNVIIDFLY